jgi:hypothetical protein
MQSRWDSKKGVRRRPASEAIQFSDQDETVSPVVPDVLPASTLSSGRSNRPAKAQGLHAGMVIACFA